MFPEEKAPPVAIMGASEETSQCGEWLAGNPEWPGVPLNSLTFAGN